MNSFEFADPNLLFLVLIRPAIGAWNWKRKKPAAVAYSSFTFLKNIPRSALQRLRPILTIIQFMALTLVIIGLARPRTKDNQAKVTAEGIDIMLAMDISRSMLIEDMGGVNRLDAAKSVAEKFVRDRQTDRIGLVVFAGQSFTQCPLTVDYHILVTLIKQVRIGVVEDGTAIGMGIINAINRLRESKAKSRVIILLTDGENNRGEIDPITASQIAQALGIRIYTIGAGKDGVARIPVDDPFFGRQYVSAEVKIDETTLRKIAENTGGQFFRATNLKSLTDIYEQIGQLEKTKIEVKSYLRYGELYPYVIVPAMLLLLLYIVLSETLFFRIP